MKKVISVILCIILAIPCQACGMSNNNDKVIVDDEKGLDIVKMIADGSATDLKRGQVVALGKYEQDNNESNGSETINWIVLNVNKESKEILLISKYALDCKPYDDVDDLKKRFPDNSTGDIAWDKVNVTWEDCTLRSWLNADFYNNVFSDDEKKLIRKTSLTNVDNTYGTSVGKGGNSTQDNVFLLSLDDIVNTDYGYEYSSETADEGRRCTATEYAKAHGAKNFSWNGKLACWWWLRSPGMGNRDAAYVSDHGYVGMYGVHVSHFEYDSDCCVRPAIIIGLE